jgi:hypothetical protein
MLKALVTALQRVFGALIGLLILFEEWGWEPLQRAVAALTRLPPLAWLERCIAALPPRAALAVFVLPSLMLLPLKLLALWLLGQGHALAGVLLIVAAKLVGTAVVARLFSLTRPALLQLAWFARFYARWTGWKQQLLAQVRASWAWRAGRRAKARWRERWNRWRDAV